MEEKIVKLSIVTLSWNTLALTKQCLESVISSLCLVASDKESNTLPITSHKSPATSHQPLTTEIIIVENGSTDGSVEYIKSVISDQLSGVGKKSRAPLTAHRSPITIKLITNKENVGFTKGNNQGINKAQGKYVMLLNSDTIVKPGAISKMIDYLDKNSEVDCIAPRLLNIDGTFQENCGHFPNLGVVFIMLFKEHFGGSDSVRYAPLKSDFVDWMMGSAIIARREVFDKIGGLDERIFMYMEEVDWFYRVHKAGFKSYCLIDAEIIHLGRGSSTTGKKDPILGIYRGLLIYYRKHKTKSELLLLIVMLKLKAVLALLLGYLKNDTYLKETYGQAVKIN